ncbi:MAG TPA: LytTR family DNA-binding domain-containing protein [Bacteroidia bacterium]
MIKALIVEDEKQSSQLLNTLVGKHCKDIEVVATAANVKQAVAAIHKHQPDLVFLDITMPDGSGFDLLEKVSPIQFDIIFTTATDKHAIKAIKYAALDYLLKPIDVEELKSSVNKLILKKNNLNTVENLTHLLDNLKENSNSYQKITLPTGTAYEIVYIKDIIRCEADGSYTTFFLTHGKKLLVTHALIQYEELLPEKEFMRVHRHHLININHVTRYIKTEGFAIMSDDAKIEVSRRKKDEFLGALRKV